MRAAAIERLARLIPAWPDLPFTERGEGGLADAIVQEVVRRWRTLDWACGVALDREPATLEPPLRAALLAASAQLLLMDEPDHAVVNDTVEWSKRTIRPGAGKLANAVLRRLAGWRGERAAARPEASAWWHERDLLPRSDGSMLRLRGVALPEAPAARLAVASSHAEILIARWIDHWGEDEAARVATHALAVPPRIVADPRGTLRGDPRAMPHSRAGFVVWEASLGALREALARDPALRVQDPGSAAPVERSAAIAPKRIVDACAGRGTKTRQLATLHPDSEIFAGDVDAARRRDLERAFRDSPRVRVLEPEAIMDLREIDLLVLDVPCSNTGVLARRPEAKYRFDQRRLASLVAVQRAIVASHLPSLAKDGRVIYAVCSLEPEELDAAAEHLTSALGRDGARESRLPSGGPGADAATHADGGASFLI